MHINRDVIYKNKDEKIWMFVPANFHLGESILKKIKYNNPDTIEEDFRGYSILDFEDNIQQMQYKLEQPITGTFKDVSESKSDIKRIENVGDALFLVEITNIMKDVEITDNIRNKKCALIFNVDYAKDLIRSSHWVNEDSVFYLKSQHKQQCMIDPITDTEERREYLVANCRKDWNLSAVEDVISMTCEYYSMAIQMLRYDSVLLEYVRDIFRIGYDNDRINYIHNDTKMSTQYIVLCRYEIWSKKGKEYLRQTADKSPNNAWLSLWDSSGEAFYPVHDKLYLSRPQGKMHRQKTLPPSEIDVVSQFPQCSVTWTTKVHDYTGYTIVQRFVGLCAGTMYDILSLIQVK